MPVSGANLSETPAGIGRLQLSHEAPVFTLGNAAHLGLFVVVACAALTAIGIGLSVGVAEGVVCLLATAALGAAALPLVRSERSELYEPVWFVLLTVGIGVTGKAFYVCLGPPERVSFLLVDLQPRDLVFAALVLAAGVLCLSVGYILGDVRWRIGLLDRLTSDDWNRRRSVAVIGALLIVGVFSFVMFASQQDFSLGSLRGISAKRFAGTLPGGGFAVGSGYQRWGATLIEIAFYIAFAQWVAAGKRFRSLSGAGILLFGLLAIAFPVFVSSRQTLMFVIIRAIVIWLCLRGYPKPRYVLALVIAGLAAIGTIHAARRGLTDWRDIREHYGPAKVAEVTIGGRHFLDLTKTALVLDAFPERLDFMYGKSMITWLVAPIPRAWWPGKPNVGVGAELATAVYRKPPHAGGAPPALPGELYLNFGLGGVLVGLLAAGLVLRSIYATLRPRFPSKSIVLIYTVLVTRLALGMLSNSVSGSASKLLQEMVPLVVALYLCSLPVQRSDGGR